MPFTFPTTDPPLLDARATRRGGVVCPVCSEPLAAPAAVPEGSDRDARYRAGVVFPAYIVERPDGRYAFTRKAKRALDRHQPDRVLRRKLPRASVDRDTMVGDVAARLLAWAEGPFGERLAYGALTFGPPQPFGVPWVVTQGDVAMPRVTPVPVTVVCRCGRQVRITRDTVVAALRNAKERAAPDDRERYDALIASLTE